MSRWDAFTVEELQLLSRSIKYAGLVSVDHDDWEQAANKLNEELFAAAMARRKLAPTMPSAQPCTCGYRARAKFYLGVAAFSTTIGIISLLCLFSAVRVIR